jgi:hypothetical protein
MIDQIIYLAVILFGTGKYLIIADPPPNKDVAPDLVVTVPNPVLPRERNAANATSQ